MSRNLILLGMVMLAFCGSHHLQATVSADDNPVDLLLVLAAPAASIIKSSDSSVRALLSR
jgi:hypothetical protein